MVMNILSDQHYDAFGLATKLPVTHDRKESIKAELLHIGVFCLDVSLLLYIVDCIILVDVVGNAFENMP